MKRAIIDININIQEKGKLIPYFQVKVIILL